MSKRRVVITGLGTVSPLGLNVADTWAGIIAGKSGVSLIDQFDTTGYPTKISASVKGFNPELYVDVKEARRLDTFVLFAVAAATEALQDSGLVLEKIDLDRAGVAIGSGVGGLPLIEKSHSLLTEFGPRRVSPFFIPGSIVNMAAGQVSIKYGLKGPNISIVTACTTGSHNIGEAARIIRYGDADVMLAGGTEMATSPLGVSGFSALRALSTRNDDPTRASRPCDKDRDGFVLGDGAGVVVLEEYQHAIQRGARIYAELKGYGLSADAYHMTAPDPTGSGFVKVMQNALRDAGLPPTAIDYINPHATSTPLGDQIEAMAIKKAFADHAKRLAVSATKSMTGHLLGAAGAVEAIFSILAIRDQIAPPTINLDNPDEGCDLDFVPHTARHMKINAVMSNSFGFGGSNASLIFTKLS